MLCEILVSSSQTGFQTDLGLPTECIQPVAVHELSGGAVGFGGVKVDKALVAHGLAHCQRQFFDGDIIATAHVDVALHGLGMGVKGGLGQVHDKDASAGHVVHIQKLTPWGAAAPDADRGCAT